MVQANVADFPLVLCLLEFKCDFTLVVTDCAYSLASSTGLVQTSQMAKIGIIVGVVGFVLGYFLLTVVFPFPTA